MAKVSIIVPTYNVEMYLEECLESIKRQTLKDIEVICVNDGSTDGSLAILQRYAKDDDRFIIIDKENLDVYINQLVFLKLDDFIDEHKNDVGFENLNLYTYENSGDKNDHTESGIYAIEISNMAFFDDMNLEKRYPEERKTMYLALARTSKRPDTAEAFAVEVISTNKE